MSTKGDWNKLLDQAVAAGARIVKGRSGAVIVLSSDLSKKPVVLHGSPSDKRAFQNAVADMRRAGIPVDRT